MELILVIQFFVVSFFLNLLWELVHSQLYETCLKMPLKRFISLIVFVSLKDGFSITLFITLSKLFFSEQHQILIYLIFSLMFAFIVEKVSLRMKRWKYSKEMITVFGVGLSPLFQLALTGFVAWVYIFYLI